jgi:protein AATF/BFR2
MDPESDVDAYDAIQRKGEDDSDEDLEDIARSHARYNYIDVAPSKMRRQANFMEGVEGNQYDKFSGISTTRKEMMGDEDDGETGEEEEEEEEEEREEEDEEESLDERGMGSDESDEDDESDGEGENMEEDARRSAPRKKPQVRFESNTVVHSNGAALNAAQSDAQLLQNLRKRSREDAEKGRDARKQMDAWGKLLGVRIRGQKVVRGAGRISSEVIQKSMEQFSEADREAYDSTLQSLDEMSSHLFTLQRQVLQSFTGTDAMESSVISTGLNSLEQQLDIVTRSSQLSHDEAMDNGKSHLDTLFKFDQTVFDPLWRDVLARWTSRTSVSNLDEGHRNKFENSLKAMNQSAEDQIDRGLSGDAFDRLRKRTRVWRGSEAESRIVLEERSEDEEDSGEEKKEEADIFDDSDFYASMLRELIDSRGAASVMGASGADSSLAWAQAAKRASKKNRNGDLKTSKGRKLRFDVIEKLENFMPPIPRETWNRDQIDRLINQLREGDQAAEEKGPSNKAEAGKEGRVDLAGLRLFG